MNKSLVQFSFATLLFILTSCQSAEDQMLEQIRVDAYNEANTQDTIDLNSESTSRKDKEAVSVDLYVTKGDGYSACVSKDDLDRMIKYAAQNDVDAIQDLLNSNRCIAMSGGVEVFLESAGVLSGVVQIRPKGQEGIVWTVREAITKK
jgi:hypothetical protein